MTTLLKKELQSQLAHLGQRGCEVRDLEFEPVARPREIEEVEGILGFKIPPSFREVLLTVSRHVGFWWFAPDDRKFPPPFEGNFCGHLEWELDYLPQYEEHRLGWVREVFPNRDNSYDVIWHNKLAFCSVGNGDMLSIDLSSAHYEQIVYLSHDDGRGHGYVLADNFPDLLQRWMPLAFTGAEDWQWLPFILDRKSKIDPHGANAKAWRRLLELK